MGKKAREAKAEEAKKTQAEQPKTEAIRSCPCGCGTSLLKKRVFEQGHDARIRGWFVKVEKGKMELTEPILKKAFPIWQTKGSGAFVKEAIVAAMAS
jgi:hypothetical protein